MPPLSDPDTYSAETAARINKKLKELASRQKKISSGEYFFT
jgi:hypothetical protein